MFNQQPSGEKEGKRKKNAERRRGKKIKKAKKIRKEGSKDREKGEGVIVNVGKAEKRKI